jgi:hypothetical protein
VIINLLGQRWRIRYSKKSPFLNGNAGRLDADTNTIWIRSDMNTQQQRATIFHEILHWCLYSIGRDLKEKDVMALESAILSVFDVKIKKFNIL